MIQPDALKSDRPLKWSAGTGTDVWSLFCACIAGDLDAVKRLLANDPALARCHHHYRKPLYFAVRENRLEVAALLLECDPDPFGLAVNDSLLEITRDRGYPEMERLLETKFAERFGASPCGEPAAAAIREHDLAKLRALIEAAPELLHAGDQRSNQPIHWAVMTRQLDRVDELLTRGALPRSRRGPPRAGRRHLFHTPGMGGEVRAQGHGRIPPATRSQTQTARRSILGYAPGLGDAPRISGNCRTPAIAEAC